MTRGKHAAAAARRREVAELERRAEKAEHAATRLEAELTELRESSERQISGLRAELRQLAKERDLELSPALKAEHDRYHQLKRELDSTRAELRWHKKTWARFPNMIFDYLMDNSFPPDKTAELLRKLAGQLKSEQFAASVHAASLEAKERQRRSA